MPVCLRYARIKNHIQPCTHIHSHKAWSRENKGDSSSEREKVRSSSASKKSFVIEGIKHFLSTSCSLSPTHHPNPSTRTPPLPLTASLFSHYSANFPSPAPMLTLGGGHANTQLTFTQQSRAATSNIHIAYTLTHTHNDVINGQASGSCLVKRQLEECSVGGERGPLVLVRPPTDSHHAIVLPFSL